MEERHRNKIITNLEVLVQGTPSVEVVLKSLVEKEVFTDWMASKIMKENTDEERKRKMYTMILTRGPEAFTKLYHVLWESNLKELATILRDRSITDVKHFDTEEVKVSSVKKGDTKFDLDTSKVYVMGSRPKGYMLLININEYKSDFFEKRPFSSIDVERIRKLWTDLGFEVILHKDLTMVEFFKALEIYRDMEEHKKTHSSVVYIMSSTDVRDHEKRHQFLWSSDCFKINTEEVINVFMGSQFRTKLGQPKLFFFQTFGCERKISTDGTEPSSIMTEASGHRETADFFIVETSFPEKTSIPQDNGSCFVQTLCEIFEEGACNLDLVNLMSMVGRRMRTFYDPIHQFPTFAFGKRGFSKKLYFHPGLYD